MARKNTFESKQESPAFADILEQDVEPKTDLLEDFIPEVTKKQSVPEVPATPTFPIDKSMVPEYDDSQLRRTFVLEPILVSVFDELTNDKSTGKKKKGSKGIIKKFINNALLKEFVELGLIETSELENLDTYKDLDKFTK